MDKYEIGLVVYKIDDKKMLKILSPIFIWAITCFALLVLVCNAPKSAAIITVPLMFIGFLMIIPVFIKMYKKSRIFKANQRACIDAQFELKGKKAYLDGREVVITFYHAEDGKEVISVRMLFDKWSGYLLDGDEIEKFVKFAEINKFPINVDGSIYPKKK
ncbi:MAG: hypothetical protein IKL00_03920 [Oscillospiraceae bacterium]|nr:hypothetical protein [Oscillospiraceae bacterium]